jgi:transposase InsO family protein
VYGTARLSPRTREFLVDQSHRVGVSRAACNVGTSRRTVYRWRGREGYLDHSSRPQHSPRRTPDTLEATILGLRLELRWGPDRLGPYLGVPRSTTYAVLRRHRAHRLGVLFPPQRPVHGRFHVDAPGYIAIDIKSLGSVDRGGGRRGPMHYRHNTADATVGWTHLFVAIDLASRLVFARLQASRGNAAMTAFLAAAVAFYDARGIRVHRVLTDNAFRSTFDRACAVLGISHRRTQPYHPWTNGRVEAFIGTVQRECVYARPFGSDAERALALWLYLAYYNAERPHTAIGGVSPECWLRARGVTGVYGDFS